MKGYVMLGVLAQGSIGLGYLSSACGLVLVVSGIWITWEVWPGVPQPAVGFFMCLAGWLPFWLLALLVDRMYPVVLDEVENGVQTLSRRDLQSQAAAAQETKEFQAKEHYRQAADEAPEVTER